MRPAHAWLLVALLAALSVLPFTAPWEWAAAQAGAAFLLVRRRGWFLAFVAFTAAWNVAILAWAVQGGAAWEAFGVSFSAGGAARGAAATARLAAVVGANWFVLERVQAAVWIEALHLPNRLTAFVAAVLLAARDLGRDHQALAASHRGSRARAGRRGLRAKTSDAIAVLPSLIVLAYRRGHARRDALRVAGVAVPSSFAPIVSMTALAIAGRLALVAVPNVSLTYVVVFLAGALFGWRVGAWTGGWSMLLSDLAISGLVPTAFVNVPAMALVGVAGAWLPRLDGVARTAAAASAGLIATFAFSVVSDTADWLLLPELRGEVAVWQARVVAGLVFNVVPALTNAGLFALAIGPVHAAMTAYLTSGASAKTASGQ